LSMIGILGGTFDPIHMGHMQVAEQLQLRLALDEVHFLPCAIPVHRDIPQASDANRIRMIELAIAGNNQFRLNTLELDRGGPSYMVDTLKQIRAQKLTNSICLILGVDAFNRFQSWKSTDEILQLCHLVVYPRPGIALDRSIYCQHWVDSEQMLRDNTRACILPMEIKTNSCSSTSVRNQLLEQRQASPCLSPAVFKFIKSNHLYEKSN